MRADTALPWLLGHQRGERGWPRVFIPLLWVGVIWQRRVNPNMLAEHGHCGLCHVLEPWVCAVMGSCQQRQRAADPGGDRAVPWGQTHSAQSSLSETRCLMDNKKKLNSNQTLGW